MPGASSPRSRPAATCSIWRRPTLPITEALALAVALGMQPLAARCRLGLGRLHQRAGDGAVAREHLGAAREMIESMGMVPAGL